MSGIVFADATAAFFEFQFFLPVALAKTIPRSKIFTAEFFETSFAHLVAFGILELEPFTFLWNSGKTRGSIRHIVEIYVGRKVVKFSVWKKLKFLFRSGGHRNSS